MIIDKGDNLNLLLHILLKDKPSKYIINNLDFILNEIPELFYSINFNQNNIWHVYDVFNHILHVVDGVPNNLTLRIAALFHDIGKPFVYKEDDNGIGHFYNHWNVSNEIFLKFANKNNLEEDLKKRVSNLILYHDINIGKLNNEELIRLINIFGKEDLILFFKLKRSDLLAQNSKFHYLLDEYKKQELKLLKMY